MWQYGFPFCNIPPCFIKYVIEQGLRFFSKEQHTHTNTHSRKLIGERNATKGMFYRNKKREEKHCIERTNNGVYNT